MVLRTIGIDLTQELYDRHFLGRTDLDGLASLLRWAFPGELMPLSMEELIAGKRQTYLSLVESKDLLYPRVREVIRELSKFFRLAIVTGSSKAELTAVLTDNDVLEKFACVVTAEDFALGKPDPEGYLVALRKLSTSPTEAVAVEDSPAGVQAARAAGLRCIAVLHTSPRAGLVLADALVENIAALDKDLVSSVLGRSENVP